MSQSQETEDHEAEESLEDITSDGKSGLYTGIECKVDNQGIKIWVLSVWHHLSISFAIPLLAKATISSTII